MQAATETPLPGAERPMLVLYGSQTGCAQEVAERIAWEGKRRLFRVRLAGAPHGQESAPAGSPGAARAHPPVHARRASGPTAMHVAGCSLCVLWVRRSAAAGPRSHGRVTRVHRIRHQAWMSTML